MIVLNTYPQRARTILCQVSYRKAEGDRQREREGGREKREEEGGIGRERVGG